MAPLRLALVAALALQCDAKKKKRRRRPQEPPKEKMTLHPADYCLGCLAFVEDYQEALSAIYAAGAASNRAEEDHVGPDEIWAAIAARQTDYAEKVRDAGRYLKQTALHRVQLGAHLSYESQSHVDARAEVVARKRNLCVDELQACVPGATESADAAPLAKGDRCGACKTLVVDFEFVAKRAGLQVAEGARRSKTWLRDVVFQACEDAGYRHARPTPIEAFCEELLDEHEAGVVGAIDEFYGFVRDLRVPAQDLEQAICYDVARVCPKRPRPEKPPPDL